MANIHIPVGGKTKARDASAAQSNVLPKGIALAKEVKLICRKFDVLADEAEKEGLSAVADKLRRASMKLEAEVQGI